MRRQPAAVVRLFVLGACVLALAGCGRRGPISYAGPTDGWPQWGRDASGERYSPLNQITTENIGRLKRAWVFHMGAPKLRPGLFRAEEATPVLDGDTLFTCSSDDRVFAIDARTGRERWRFDPHLREQALTFLHCKGVSLYHDPALKAADPCGLRVLTGTLDGRLIALDGRTGQLCKGFGQGGEVDMRAGLGQVLPDDYLITSPPTIVGDTAIVGGEVMDNLRVDIAAGVIRAIDVHTGAVRWAWNPVPPGRPATFPTPAGPVYTRGTPNSWSIMSVDPKLGLVYVPTGNPSPDLYGGARNGIDYYGSSVVALNAATGQVVWNFQTVHHDLWDFDIPAQPVLFDMPTASGPVPALAQATKQGQIYILDRRTGRPLVPIVERKVAASDLPGEKTSPTQPVPANPAYSLYPRALTIDDMWGFTPWDRDACRKMFRKYDYKGPYSPPTLKGVVTFPFYNGIMNWGGLSVDPTRDILIVNSVRVAAVTAAVPRAEADRRIQAGEKLLPAAGAPYGFSHLTMLSPLGAPCNRPPWGLLTAIDVKAGRKLWEIPFGSTRDEAMFPLWLPLGVPNIGGPITTASGLAFIGAATDGYLRAIDIRTGRTVWRARLPAGGQANPMTYRINPADKQYLVITAGGHQFLKSRMGDSIVAFTLQ